MTRLGADLLSSGILNINIIINYKIIKIQHKEKIKKHGVIGVIINNYLQQTSDFWLLVMAFFCRT